MNELALLLIVVPVLVLVGAYAFFRLKARAHVAPIVGTRARGNDGKFVADNPETKDWNEAYIGGKRKVK